MPRNGHVVIITKPGDPTLYGPVELSFSLDVRPNQTFRYWSSTGTHPRSSIEWSDKDITMWKASHPDWTFERYEVNDPKLPIILDWEAWDDACTPSSNTISGVKNKYGARNLNFHKKNNHELAAQEVE